MMKLAPKNVLTQQTNLKLVVGKLETSQVI